MAGGVVAHPARKVGGTSREDTHYGIPSAALQGPG